MKWLLALPLLAVSLLAQTELGTITIYNGLTWDNNTETNLAGYRIYVGELGETNLTAFQLKGEVTTNIWRGDTTKALHGKRKVYLTAFNTAGLESEPSEIIVLTFKAGVPLPPKNFKLFTVIHATAESALPPLPE